MTIEASARPASAATADPGDLAALYRSWEILDLVGETVDAMPRAWLEILNLARTIISGDPLKGIEVPGDLAKLVTEREQTFVTLRHTEHKRHLLFSHSDDAALRPLQNLTDFAQITMPDLLLRDLSPEVFEYQLVSGGINGLYNLELRPSYTEWDEIREERIPLPDPGSRRRQKVYALLDVSNSMRDANKVLFAKAMVLAYLVTARAEGARIYFRTFGNTVHERTDCLEPGDFPALARRVLTVTPDGSTDIKGALDTVIGDIRAIDGLNTFERMFDAPETEIFLISDCESYTIPFIPRGMKLHTVHLNAGRMMTAYRDGFEKIRNRSETFHEIDTTPLQLPDTLRDRWLLHHDGRALEPPSTLPSFGEGGKPRTPAGERQRLMKLYEKLEGARQKGHIRAGMVRMTRRPLNLLARLRELWAAIRHPRRARAQASMVRPVMATHAIQFRQRR